MVVTNVSAFYKKNFDYSPQEIVNKDISVLMPTAIKNCHHSLFL